MQAIVSLRLTRGPLSEDIVGQYVLSVQVGSHHSVHDFERFMIYIYILYILKCNIVPLYSGVCLLL